MRTSSLGILVVLFLMCGAAAAAELFGTVDDVDGSAVLSSVTGVTTALSVGTRIYVGQSITTANDGEVHIVTTDSALLALRPNSNFRVERYQAKGEETDEITFSLLKGALRSISGWIAKRNPAAYKLHTPTATIGVRGTDHETYILETSEGDDQPGTYDTVYEGMTVMRSERGDTEVRPGESAYAARDAEHAPVLLARRPAFMERRSLRIEHRIQQRKESLREGIHKRMELKNEVRKDKAERTVRRERDAQRPREHRKQQRPQ
ncbi:MAG: FecR domain-containing protein [Pseudomonadota bacterium]